MMSKHISNRFGVPLLFIAQGLILFFVLRVTLLVTYWAYLPHDLPNLLKSILIGFRMDLAVLFFLSLPFLIYCGLMPNRLFEKPWHNRILQVAYLFALYFFIFLNIADYYFFDEFNSRFNYIAIDYLSVSPREVLENIWESYPVPAVLVIVALLIGLIMWPTHTTYEKWVRAPVSILQRMGSLVLAFTISFLALRSIDIKLLNENSNRIMAEVSANGFYTLGYALLTSHMSYDDYYPTLDKKLAYSRVAHLVVRPGHKPTGNIDNPIERRVSAHAGLGKVNVVIILEESLGSHFVGKLKHRPDNLTPYLDRLADQGIFFTRFYSTGTRTIRGLEAVLASFPPIPGASIVKRRYSHQVATLARVLKNQGYKNYFIYGGRGIFDGMRDFTMSNGFDRFIEQKDFPHPTFTSVWGVSDEDIFKKSIETFDDLYQKGGPFFATILSVSNHKPYSYPAGRIDLDPKARSRDHAVKYADWALGHFFIQAQSHPFFKSTIFVVLGDHGARVYGADFIPIESYEIPLLIYSPHLLKSRTINILGCSMDVAPTVMGLLGLEYISTFYGRDMLSLSPKEGYALLQHDRDVGLLRGDHLAVLSTRKSAALYAFNLATNSFKAIPHDDKNGQDLIQDAISFYETAYDLYSQGHYFVKGS